MLTASAFNHPLKPTQGKGVSGQAQISFSFTATGGKPEQVSNGIGFMTSIGMVQVGKAGQVEQHKRHLEKTPASVLRLVERTRTIFNG